jgi:predicted O-methyltransferase YrrM
MQDRINLIFGDALEVEIDENIKYDIIFIDAAKSQYIKFFEKFEKHLNKDGIIVSDNLLFHGLIENETDTVGKDLRAMLRKIRNYNEWLKNNDLYDTLYLKANF